MRLTRPLEKGALMILVLHWTRLVARLTRRYCSGIARITNTKKQQMLDQELKLVILDNKVLRNRW